MSDKEISERNTLVYEQLVNNIEDCECVKYKAYRSASKLHLIQRFLWFDHIDLEVINGVLTRHSIFTIDNGSEICPDELDNVLHDIYFASLKSVCSSNYIKLEVLVNLCVKFLKSCYGQSLKVLDVKVALASLCSCSPNEKFVYCFSQLTDHNLRVSPVDLRHFLVSLFVLSKYLSESESDVDKSVESVLNSLSAQLASGVGLGQDEFLAWTSSRPPYLAWFSTFYRFCSSKNVAHSVKCAWCSSNPIVGLRYSCLECLSYNLCQSCFFGGKVNRNHKISHSVVEYCRPAGSCATASEYVKTLVKRWCPHKKRTVSGSVAWNGCDNVEDSVKQLDRSLDRLDSSLVPSDRLTDVIAEIEHEADRVDGTHHASFLRRQAQRLRQVKCCLTAPVASTPFGAVSQTYHFDPTYLPMSPVTTTSKPPSPLRIPGDSDFSTWLRQSDSLQTSHLQADVEKILGKINKMLETSFWTYD